MFSSGLLFLVFFMGGIIVGAIGTIYFLAYRYDQNEKYIEDKINNTIELKNGDKIFLFDDGKYRFLKKLKE